MTLTGAETATPSFVAPLGPTRVTLSLSVSNGTETSVASTVTITVLGVPPSFVNADSATFKAGTFGSFAFLVEGSPAPEVTVSGRPPPGLTFVDEGDGSAIVAGPCRPTSARRADARLPADVEAINEYGEVKPSFSLEVTVLAERPTPSPEPSPRPQSATPVPTAVVLPAFVSPSIVFGYADRRLEVPIKAMGTPVRTSR